MEAVHLEPRPDAVDGFIAAGRQPAVLRRAGFEFDDLVQDVLPGALGDHGVAVSEDPNDF
jgi:hypothetical protein